MGRDQCGIARRAPWHESHKADEAERAADWTALSVNSRMRAKRFGSTSMDRSIYCPGTRDSTASAESDPQPLRLIQAESLLVVKSAHYSMRTQRLITQ